MQNISLARNVGFIGMVGGALWIVSTILQNSLGIESSSGTLGITSELIALTALVTTNVGFLGLILGGAFQGRFGTFAVGTHILAYMLIVLGGVARLLLGDAAGPLYLLFPLGGALEGIAAMLLAVAVITTGRWVGWQRWIPLLYSLYHILGVGMPLLLGATPDGPRMSIQIGTGVWWFLVGLAVYTAQSKAVALQPALVGQD